MAKVAAIFLPRLLVFHYLVDTYHAAVHADVTVAGSTLGAGFKRLEGLSTYKENVPRRNGFTLSEEILIQSRQRVRSLTHIHAATEPSAWRVCSDQPRDRNQESGSDQSYYHIDHIACYSSDCDGGLVTEYSQCCPSDATACHPGPRMTCKSNPTLSTFCPSSYPHVCAAGQMCSSTVWKPRTGSDSDCDGHALSGDGDSVCCPTGGVVKCSRMDTEATCKPNLAFGMQHALLICPTFYMTRFLRSRLPQFPPLPVQGRSEVRPVPL